ncbi:MAG: polysaccharide pyruvyl transferase family protein [Chloroflexi bacterium]|nr:polysaccharide pyruvyl transferase family protein [Chloroflexota bacterium]
MNIKKSLFPFTAQSALRVLLLGYSGANNTGAEALLLADIEDVRAVFGPQVVITIPSINPPNLRRYVKETPNLRIAPLPTIFFSTLRRLVRENDLVMLVEGSTYMDTWSSVLLWAYLWTTRCADDMGKPCLAYAVDAGEIKSAFNRWLVRHEASKTSLIITRAAAAAKRMHSYGVTAPLEVTADNAFSFCPNPADAGLLFRAWPEAGPDVVGMALVDFYQWPVVMKPWGPKADCYKRPLYFTHSPERTRLTEALARSYAALADDMITRYDKSVALIGMEELDEAMLHKVHGYMVHPERARIFCSRQYNASQMVSILRSLDLLLTSRYHACVLSLAAQVPQIAIGHDLRLKTIYQELGLFEDFFVEPGTHDLYESLKLRVERLLEDPYCIQEALQVGFEQHQGDARRNRTLLKDFVLAQGWEPVPGAATIYMEAA